MEKQFTNSWQIVGVAFCIYDIASSWIDNYKSGNDSWVTDSIYDNIWSVAICITGFIPGYGWAISLALTATHEIFEITGVNETWKEIFNDFISNMKLELGW